MRGTVKMISKEIDPDGWQSLIIEEINFCKGKEFRLRALVHAGGLPPNRKA